MLHHAYIDSDKFSFDSGDQEPGSQTASRLWDEAGRVVSSRLIYAEARAALSELGYAPDEIRGALDGLRDDVGVEEMLRLALRELASR